MKIINGKPFYNISDDNRIKLHTDAIMLFQVISLAKNYYLYAFDLAFPQTTEKRNFVKGNPVFKVCNIALWKLCCIELYKAFKFKDLNGKIISTDKSKKYPEALTLLQIFDNFENGRYGEDLKDLIELEIWHNKIQKLKPALDQLQFYRDKVYAHTEIVDRPKNIKIRYGHIDNLIRLGYEVIDFIYNKILNWSHNVSEFPYSETDVDSLLKKLIS